MVAATISRRRSNAYLAAGLIFAVALLALILRLWFIFEVSQIEVVWDANDYWSEMQLVRNRICGTLGYCTPDPSIAANTTFSSIMRGVLFERLGIMPFLGGIILTILPVEPLSIYIVYAVLGSLICLMIISVLLRLGFPLWVALLGGIFHAVYIPAITGEGTVLQQPFIRLCLALVVWSYVLAFTSQKRLFIWFWVGLATTASILVGYASITTRPLMWLIPLSVLLLTWRSAPRIFRVQFVYFGLLVGAVITAAILLTVKGQETLEAAARLSTGLGAQGDSISSATTIATFPQIWPPSEWWRDFPAGSLGSDFARAPALFLNRLAYSVFANWRYPDYFFLQQFILTLEGQKIQHLLIVVMGFLGLAALLGQPGLRRRTALLILVIGLYVSLSNSVISIEPRRLSVLSPFLAIGAAVLVGSVVAGLRSYPRTLVFVIDALLLALCLAAWWLPLPFLMEYVRVELAVAYALLVALRALLTMMVIWRLLRFWERSTSQFGKRWAAVLLLASLALLPFVAFQDTEWRTWQVTTTSRIAQSIEQFRQYEHLFAWLLLDVEPEQARNMAISINNRLLKAEGEAMLVWEAGVPPTWSAYLRLSDIATIQPPRRLWLAYPISPEYLSDTYIDIELRSEQGAFTLSGDYVSGTSYIGPSFDPWHSGLSFWRWQWNAADPRIPMEQSLDGQFYRSGYNDGSEWVAGDLSPEYGHVSGLYRIFVTWAAFGANTNALSQSSPQSESGAACGEGELLAAAPMDLQFACLTGDDGVEYFMDNVSIGTSPLEVFQSTSEANQVIDIHHTPQGRVELLKVLKTVFVANFYDSDSEPLYSLAFTLDV